MVQWVKNHEIHICGQNLHSEKVKLYMWLVWVDTQLEELISGVSDAVSVIFVDVKLKNEPNYQICIVQGVKKH